MNCPKCNTENSPSARYCATCGFDLKSDGQPPVNQPAQPPVPANQPAQTPPEQPAASIQPPAPDFPAQPPVIVVAAHPSYAGFWIRLLAWLIDTLILGVASAPFNVVSGILNIFDRRNIGFGLFPFTSLINIAIPWLYYSLMESSSYQGTLGKMALGLKVTDLNGNRISFARATGRYFARIISGLILGIGYLMIAFTDKKQGLHDMIAGTLVVKK